MLLVFGLLGIFTEFRLNDILLFWGIGLVILSLVLLMITKYHQNKRIDSILKSHKRKKQEEMPTGKKKSKVKGWSMNESPFRERKSELTWGGGNIKAAEATGVTKRKYLK